jgi:prevent-host-death family protein
MAAKVDARRWPEQDATARFSELLTASLAEGPQVVTRGGVEIAVLMPVEDWRRLQLAAKPSLKDLLLATEARADLAVPTRQRWRRPPSPKRRGPAAGSGRRR